MNQQPARPRIGLLALTLEFYEQLAPGLRESRERWLQETVLPDLAPIADVCFRGAVYRREDVDAADVLRRLISAADGDLYGVKHTRF